MYMTKKFASLLSFAFCGRFLGLGHACMGGAAAPHFRHFSRFFGGGRLAGNA